jgi:hypothetical protein
MILQYNTMFNERKRSLAIDNVNSLIESAAALLVKVCADTASAGTLPAQPLASSRAAATVSIASRNDTEGLAGCLGAHQRRTTVLLQVTLCKALMEEVLSAPTFSWRLLLLPCW